MADPPAGKPAEVIELSAPPRPRLSSVELGFPAVARLRALIGLSIAGALLASLSVFLPWHVYEGEVHTGVDHGASATVIPAAWLVSIAIMAWRRKSFGWMLGWAIVGFAAGLCCFAISLSDLWAHMFEEIDPRVGGGGNIIGCLVAFFAPLAGIMAVPIEFIRARRALARSDQARIPAARVRS